jgi:glycosyltransferase involved in cell wall biosynthesis
MAAWLACLATPVGGNPEILEHGQSGLLMPPGDVAAWGRALAELGNDPPRRARLGLAARQRILSQYDFLVVGAQYEALYRRLLSIPPTSRAVQDQLTR